MARITRPDIIIGIEKISGGVTNRGDRVKNLFLHPPRIHPCHDSAMDGRIMASPSHLEKTSLSFQDVKPFSVN